MSLNLTTNQLRVLGSLMEKALTTPDYYPMTVSALVNACNQKTSRDPITNLSDGQVQEVLDYLIAQSLIRERNPAGARSIKYAHRLGDSLGLRFGFSRPQLAVLAVLMLRGPQTPGELRTRTERLREEGKDEDIEAILEGLAHHERGTWVTRLEREPGRREARWQHLLGQAPETATATENSTTAPGEAADFHHPGVRSEASGQAPSASGLDEDTEARIAFLEDSVLNLEQTLQELAQRLARLEQ